MKQVKLLLILLVILFGSGSSFASAPDFDLRTLEGKPFDLNQVVGKGKWVLLMFWATDCQVCKIQEPQNSAFHEARNAIDAEVVGIAVDGFEKTALVKQYLADHPLSYPNYVADISVVAFNYQALTGEQFYGTPTHVLFNPEGKFMAVKPGLMRIEALEDYIARHSGKPD
jgi:peroxiredoxin